MRVGNVRKRKISDKNWYKKVGKAQIIREPQKDGRYNKVRKDKITNKEKGTVVDYI